MHALAALLPRLRTTLHTLDISHIAAKADHETTAAITAALQACTHLVTLRAAGLVVDWTQWAGGHFPELTTLDLSHSRGIEVPSPHLQCRVDRRRRACWPGCHSARRG